MSNQQRRIGFSSQRIRYAWVDRVARMQLGGMELADIKREIDAMLAPHLSHAGESGHSSRARVSSILNRTWIQPTRKLRPLRDTGILLLSSINKKERLAVHWGMVMATYPFWCDVASETGRLLRLQDQVTAGQVRRRLVESYGDREVVARATRNIMRSFVEWGCLEEKQEKGNYGSGTPTHVSSGELIAWLTEAYLHARHLERAPLDTVLGAPCFFPFIIDPITVERIVSASDRLSYMKHGLDEALVMLAGQEG